MWQRGITHAAAYHARHAHLRVPDHHVEPDGYRLGQFIVAQRMLYKRGTLAADRAAALEDLGMIWHPGTHRFNQGLAQARSYFQRHGHLRVPQTHVSRDGYRLGAWVHKQRANHRQGRLTPGRAAALDAISDTWRS